MTIPEGLGTRVGRGVPRGFCFTLWGVFYQLRVVVGGVIGFCGVFLPRLLLHLRCAGFSSPSSLPPFAMACTWSAVNDMGCVYGSVRSMGVPHSQHGCLVCLTWRLRAWVFLR